MERNELLWIIKMLDKKLFESIESLNDYIGLGNGKSKKKIRPLLEEIRMVSSRLNNLCVVISDLSLTSNTPLEHININIHNELPKIMNEPHTFYKD
jgi:hypothetical protein